MDKWCTTPGCLARLSIEGRAPFSSLGEEATQQMDGGAGSAVVRSTPGRAQAHSPAEVVPRQSRSVSPDDISGLGPACAGWMGT